MSASEVVADVPQSNTTIEVVTSPPSYTSNPEELTTPPGWKREVYAALVAMHREEDEHKGLDWLETQVRRFKQALQAENMDAPVEGSTSYTERRPRSCWRANCDRWLAGA